MAWLRLDDKLPLSVKVHGLADPGARASTAIRQRNEALGHWALILAHCGAEGTDGFLPAGIVEGYGTPASLGRLLRPTFDRAPLLHRRGETCDCLAERRWPAGAAYAMHDFLDRNPSRAETDVARAKKRELRDPELKAAVRRRDAGRCRYCGVEVNWNARRGPLRGTYDHVDPKLAAGAANLVVCCGGCNSRKKDRSLDAAGMRLLPLPGHPTHPATSTSFDTGSESDSEPTRNATATGPETDNKPVSGPGPDPPPPRPPPEPAPSSHAGPPGDTGGPDAQPATATTNQTRDGLPDGSGRVGSGPPVVDSCAASDAGPGGERRTVGPPSTYRDSVHPDPYLRSAITGPDPDEHAGWPPDEEGPPP